MRYKVTSGSYLARNKPVVANGLEEQRKRLIMVARRNVQPDNQTKVSQTPKTVEIEEIREEPRSNGRLEELRREVEELEKSSSSERRELETLGLRNKNWSVNRKKLEDEHLLMLEALSESVQENKDLHKVKDSKTSEMLQLQAKERSLEEKLGELSTQSLTQGPP